MRISVVIPTFDRLDVIRRALDSVIRQTLPPTEVIVVDDGSTDATAQLVRETYPGVKYMYQEQRGVSVARNRGINASLGDWIALLDSDDEWQPHKLERQAAALTNNPEYRICHSDEIWIRNGKRVNPKYRHQKTGGWIFKNCLPLCAISPSSVVLHRSLLDDVGMFDETLPVCEDYDLWLRICANEPVLYVDEPLVIKYGGHSNQLSRRYWGMDRFRIQALESILDSDSLKAADRQAARKTLLEKIGVYLQGAKKRGKWDEVAIYTRKQRQHGGLQVREEDEWPSSTG